MRIAPEGYREIAIASLILAAVGVLFALWFPWGLILCLIVWAWVITFFRDPHRATDYQPNQLYAPADGTVADVEEIDHPDFSGKALRIGIFLSIFNVHINRSPCALHVRKVDYQPGEFLDARHPQAGTRNESSTLSAERIDGLPGPVIVRQVAGKIARRIICHAAPGHTLAPGQRYGLIKFGSRTELIVPAGAYHATVKVGQSVRGGLTVVARISEKPA